MENQIQIPVSILKKHLEERLQAAIDESQLHPLLIEWVFKEFYQSLVKLNKELLAKAEKEYGEALQRQYEMEQENAVINESTELDQQ